MSCFDVSILTIFPEMFPGPLNYSLAGQALKRSIWSIEIINIRNFGIKTYKRVDDKNYGSGGGLIMRPDVLGKAIDYTIKQKPKSKIYYLSPRGRLLKQTFLYEIIKDEQIVLICGRFEGIDERIIDEYNIIELSIGDYILSGGECAALVLLDSCIRLLPGVIKNRSIFQNESLDPVNELCGKLEYPLYTKPLKWRNREVPGVLLSGNHKLIKEWRSKESYNITKKRRPDLLE